MTIGGLTGSWQVTAITNANKTLVLEQRPGDLAAAGRGDTDRVTPVAADGRADDVPVTATPDR